MCDGQIEFVMMLAEDETNIAANHLTASSGTDNSSRVCTCERRAFSGVDAHALAGYSLERAVFKRVPPRSCSTSIWPIQVARRVRHFRQTTFADSMGAQPISFGNVAPHPILRPLNGLPD